MKGSILRGFCPVGVQSGGGSVLRGSVMRGVFLPEGFHPEGVLS